MQATRGHENDRLADDIIETIQHGRGVSFPRLRRSLEERGWETYGDWDFCIREDLVLWGGMTEEFTDSLGVAWKRRHAVHPHLLRTPLEVLVVHSADGAIMNMPLATNTQLGRKTPRKTPGWVPVVWYPERSCEASNCLGHAVNCSCESCG